MANPFVWFDLRSKDADKSRSFYGQLLGWTVAEIPVGDDRVPMIGGEEPWATVVADGSGHLGWLPYVQVDDLDAAMRKAEELGAVALQPAAEGPAGTFVPTGSPAVPSLHSFS